MLIVAIAECHYDESRYAECHYAECRYTECHYADCHYTECRYAECRDASPITRSDISFTSIKIFNITLSIFELQEWQSPFWNLEVRRIECTRS